MNTRQRLEVGLTLALFIALLAPDLAAQQIHIQVKDKENLRPIVGALIRLLGEQGVIMQTLTTETGRATLRTSGAGSYRIRVDQIGTTSFITPSFDLAFGETRDTELVIESSRISLPPLEVRARNRCGRQTEQGSLAAVLWGEIAKALSASVIAEQTETVPLLAQRFRRELRRDGTPLREWVEYAALHRGRFYATHSPAFLLENGFVVVDQRDSVIYYAPDADLLLSDEFVTSHCFRTASGEGGLLGLAFEPVSGRSVPDVRGTLWVHRETSELKFLEYSYTGLPRELQNLGLGGRVDYRRLLTGSWIVTSWYLRAPRLEAVPVRSELRIPVKVVGRGTVKASGPSTRVVGFVEMGGRISVRTDSNEQIDRAIIAGHVVDSTTGTGLSGVVIQVRESGDSAVSDASGSFSLAVSAHGDHALIGKHPKLSLAGARSTQNVLLSLGDTTRVEFAVPSTRTLVRPLCRQRRDRAGVIGIVRGPDGAPTAGLQVRAEWHTAAGVPMEVRAWSEKGGLYALCNLPSDELIVVHLFDEEQAVNKQSLELDWGSLRWLDVQLVGVPKDGRFGVIQTERLWPIHDLGMKRSRSTVSGHRVRR
jgi:hypothetical protein